MSRDLYTIPCQWFALEFRVNSKPLTSVFGRNKVHIAHVVMTGLDVVVDSVGRYGADLHQSIVLDEDRVARQVAVHDGRHAAVEVAGEINKIDDVTSEFLLCRIHIFV